MKKPLALSKVDRLMEPKLGRDGMLHRYVFPFNDVPCWWQSGSFARGCAWSAHWFASHHIGDHTALEAVSTAEEPP